MVVEADDVDGVPAGLHEWLVRLVEPLPPHVDAWPIDGDAARDAPVDALERARRAVRRLLVTPAAGVARRVVEGLHLAEAEREGPAVLDERALDVVPGKVRLPRLDLEPQRVALARVGEAIAPPVGLGAGNRLVRAHLLGQHREVAQDGKQLLVATVAALGRVAPRNLNRVSGLDLVARAVADRILLARLHVRDAKRLAAETHVLGAVKPPAFDAVAPVAVLKDPAPGEDVAVTPKHLVRGWGDAVNDEALRRQSSATNLAAGGVELDFCSGEQQALPARRFLGRLRGRLLHLLRALALLHRFRRDGGRSHSRLGREED
mmetsp:Transcript_25554/g.76291  ORF Transcript_25554/g.76291 Transcript_25554/m.76291 type:complete len:319 (-) Transcript_25554:450-1406(-)